MGYQETGRNQPESQSGRREIIRREEAPKDAEDRFAKLLFAFNNPLKSTLVLIHHQDNRDGYLKPEYVVEQFRARLRGTEMEGISHASILGFYLNTLIPKSLVARYSTMDNLGKEEFLGFGLTEFGRKYAPFAISLIFAFEQRHKMSIFPALGAVNSSSPIENRSAPKLRADILRFLATSKNPAREVDIIREFDIDLRSVGRSLTALKKAGFINYEAVTFHTGNVQVAYTRGDAEIDEIKPVGRQVALTSEVARICQDLFEQNLPITQEDVRERLPQEIKERWNISGILVVYQA